MSGSGKLPPGQRAIADFPRFGVPAYAKRLPATVPAVVIQLELADGSQSTVDAAALASLPRIELIADLHCVTTWTRRDLRWSGYRFRDFHAKYLASAQSQYIELRGLDGHRACAPLEDLLDDDVLLADRLDGEPIPLEHGAPLRFVAPKLYGYKSVKHLCRITLRSTFRESGAERLTRAHPRGRVALEERGKFLPGPAYRLIYRALIRPTLWLYRRASRR